MQGLPNHMRSSTDQTFLKHAWLYFQRHTECHTEKRKFLIESQKSSLTKYRLSEESRKI